MDGCNPIWIILAVVILFVLTIIVYLYSSAVQNISENELEEIKEKNEKTYQKVNKIIDDPARFINTVQAVSVLITLVYSPNVTFFILSVLFLVSNPVYPKYNLL